MLGSVGMATPAARAQAAGGGTGAGDARAGGAFRTLLLTMMATPFLLRDSCPQY